MGFVFLTLGMLGFFVGVLLVVGHFYNEDEKQLVDWRLTRSPEVEVQNELDDVRQMLEAQNEMRSRRGAPALDGETLQAEVRAEELERLRRSDRFEPGS